MSRETRYPYEVTKRRALAAYREFLQQHGVMPSNAEIGRMLDMHPTYVSRLISELEDDGEIQRDKDKVTHMTSSRRAKMQQAAKLAKQALAQWENEA